MSRKCDVSGKKPLVGNNVSHAKNRTKRKFLPNLKKVTFKSDVLKRNIRLKVSMKAQPRQKMVLALILQTHNALALSKTTSLE